MIRNKSSQFNKHEDRINTLCIQGYTLADIVKKLNEESPEGSKEMLADALRAWINRRPELRTIQKKAVSHAEKYSNNLYQPPDQAKIDYVIAKAIKENEFLSSMQKRFDTANIFKDEDPNNVFNLTWVSFVMMCRSYLILINERSTPLDIRTAQGIYQTTFDYLKSIETEDKPASAISLNLNPKNNLAPDQLLDFMTAIEDANKKINNEKFDSQTQPELFPVQ